MNCDSCYSELTLYKGRYYCRDCLARVVKDPAERERLGLPKLEKKRS